MALNLPNLGDSILEYDIEQTNEINKDSGWINLNQYIKCRSKGGYVTVIGVSDGGFLIGDGVSETVGILPAGFRPDTGGVTAVPGRSGAVQGDSFVKITELGEITIFSKGTLNGYWQFTCVYPV